MKIKTNELTEIALDWAVAKCEGHTPYSDGIRWGIEGGFLPRYSTDWGHGGPIIERERIELEPTDAGWAAFLGNTFVTGTTALTAAMRCFIASKLGNEVEIAEKML